MPQQAAMEAAPKITVISHKAEQAPLTPSRKKPISTARVDVTPVTGTTNAMIPLSLKVSAAVPQETLAFKLSGLPESAYLTAGIRMGKDQWILKPAEAENARLVIPKAPAPQFTIEVAAVEVASGELVSPYVSMQVALTESPASVPFPATAAIIMPAAAPREIATNFNTGTQSAARDVVMITKENTAQPLPIPVEARQPEDSQARKLMEDGDSLMESGDLAAARAFYSQAMSLGVKEAAFAMGQTYDPSVFAEKKVLGLKPDTAQALRYYQLAATAGVAEARDAMSALQARLEQ
jgi:TPR repeat protein